MTIDFPTCTCYGGTGGYLYEGSNYDSFGTCYEAPSVTKVKFRTTCIVERMELDTHPVKGEYPETYI